MDLVDGQIGRNGLKEWPGDSRHKFVEKLDKSLKIKCIDQRNKCQDAKADGSILRGRVVPTLHQRRIALCSNNLDGTADYVSVMAHEIAHLVRLNAHRTKCVKKYERPRFAQSVGLAAYHAYQGFDYDSGYYTPYCS